MAKSKNFKPTRRETQQTIGLMIQKIQYLEESLSGLLNMLQHYIDMKDDRDEYQKYLDALLEKQESAKEEPIVKQDST
tara:strand:+ start:159 stop:392 length:234 start_codon:yes stop_codon:yes gene_type:complete